MSSPESNNWALKPVHQAGLPPWIDVHPERGLTIGRAADNSISLAASAHALVSSHHLRLSVREDGLHIHDLGSTNGTFVNGIQVKEKRLKAGDLISLGKQGPKFVIERRADLAGTQVWKTANVQPQFGESTIHMVRAAVGLGLDGDVTQMVAAQTRGSRRLITGLTIAGLAIGAAVAWVLHANSASEIQRLALLNESLSSELRGTNTELARQHQEWEAQRAHLESEKGELTVRLRRLEDDDRASEASVEQLKAKLDSTEQSLKLFDPVNLERARLDGVQAVLEAVVFIETSVQLRDPASGELVRAVQTENGDWEFRVGGTGEVFSREKTGSGFVVSADGFVLTNAHVVELPGSLSEPIEMDGRTVEPHRIVSLVFTGQSTRHEAEVIASVHDAAQDFALLKMEPFEGMQYVEGFNLDGPAPSPGAEVFLFGFPLGRNILQPGDRLVASTFKGIMSRFAEPFMQVDAAVHPGNSGGPVTDGSGHVIGIVTAVARMPEGNITPSIGYVIPIEALAAIWPPKTALAVPVPLPTPEPEILPK